MYCLNDLKDGGVLFLGERSTKAIIKRVKGNSGARFGRVSEDEDEFEDDCQLSSEMYESDYKVLGSSNIGQGLSFLS